MHSATEDLIDLFDHMIGNWVTELAYSLLEGNLGVENE